MDLMAKYLIIIIAFFSANLALILNSYDDYKKRKIFPIIYTIVLFILSALSINLFNSPDALNQYFNIIILIVSIIILILAYYFEKQELNKININDISLVTLSILEYVLIMIIISLANISKEALIYQNDPILNGLIISLSSLIIILIINSLTKGLKNKLESYENLVGEYMIVEAIFFIIIALTYNTVKNLDYTMFTPFITLTPTYQAISVVIGLCILIVLGTFIKYD